MHLYFALENFVLKYVFLTESYHFLGIQIKM